METWRSIAVSIALAAFAASCGGREPAIDNQAVATRLGVSVGAVQRMRTQKSLSARALRDMRPVEAQAVLRSLRADLPARRASYRNLQLRGSNGIVAPTAIGGSLQLLNAMRLRAGAPGGPPRPIPSPKTWTALGPRNVGGRTRSIVIDPVDPRHLWIGSVGGGIWESTDGGVTLYPVDDFMNSLAICCMAIDPSDSRIVYAGTGEGFYNEDAIRGIGILRAGPDTGGRFRLMPG